MRSYNWVPHYLGGEIFHKTFCALIAIGTIAVCRADTIYSTFGPGLSYDTTNYHSIGGGQTYPAVAVSFTPSKNYLVTGIVLPLASFSGPNQVKVEVLSDSSGAPGSIMDTCGVSGYPGTPPSLLYCGTPFSLTGGLQYWLEATTPDLVNTTFAWYDSATASGIFDQGQNGGAWVQNAGGGALPALELAGTPVPEPGAVTLVVAGAIALALTRFAIRRRRS